MLKIKASRAGTRLQLPSGANLVVPTTPRVVPTNLEDEVRKALGYTKGIEVVEDKPEAKKAAPAPAAGAKAAPAAAAAATSSPAAPSGTDAVNTPAGKAAVIEKRTGGKGKGAPLPDAASPETGATEGEGSESK